MFFHITLERSLLLEPRYFGPNLRSTLVNKLHSEVEGTCSARYGFIITVTSVEHLGMGKVQEGTGCVIFPVKFKAIVFRPFKNEILDAVVTQVNKMGFFAEAGPLQQIPADMTFDPQAVPPCFVSDDGSVRIEKDSEVRLKILGTRVDESEIFSIGTIKEDFLGLIG